MDAILVERDYKGIYERFALTPEEFAKEFPDTYEQFGPFKGVVNTLGKGGELSSFEYSDSDTLRPMVHIWFCPTDIGSDLWKTFFTDMEWGLPESDIESGNLAYIREDFMQSLMEYLPENTRINYLYRDAANYKFHNEVVVSGKITEEQIEQIIDALHDGEWFIPAKVGLPAEKFKTYDPEVDHYWFELQEDGFENTRTNPTIEITVDELVESFKGCKGSWEVGIDEYGNLVPKTEHKPGIDELISDAQQKVEEKRTWVEEKREELSNKPRSKWTEEDWDAHNYCDNTTAEADYYDGLDDR